VWRCWRAGRVDHALTHPSSGAEQAHWWAHVEPWREKRTVSGSRSSGSPRGGHAGALAISRTRCGGNRRVEKSSTRPAKIAFAGGRSPRRLLAPRPTALRTGLACSTEGVNTCTQVRNRLLNHGDPSEPVGAGLGRQLCGPWAEQPHKWWGIRVLAMARDVVLDANGQTVAFQTAEGTCYMSGRSRQWVITLTP